MIVAYIVQATRADEPLLSVSDGVTFYQFELTIQNLARLNAECAAIINASLGGVDYKRAMGDVTAAWSKAGVPPSGRCQCSDPDGCLGCRGEV